MAKVSNDTVAHYAPCTYIWLTTQVCTE